MRKTKNILALMLSAILCYLCVACSFQSKDDTNEPSTSLENTSVTDITSLYEWEEVSGGLKLTKYLGNDKKIVVPSSIENKSVVSIGTTFSGNIVIEEIELPDSVRSGDLIGCKALKRVIARGIQCFLNLKGCESLEYLELSGVEEKKDFSISNISNPLPVLHELKLPKLKELNVWEGFSYEYLPGLKKLDISGATVVSLSYYSWPSNLEEVKINENINYYQISFDTGKVGMICTDEHIDEHSDCKEITQDNINEVYCELFQCEKIVVNGVEYKK